MMAAMSPHLALTVRSTASKSLKGRVMMYCCTALGMPEVAAAGMGLRREPIIRRLDDALLNMK